MLINFLFLFFVHLMFFLLRLMVNSTRYIIISLSRSMERIADHTYEIGKLGRRRYLFSRRFMEASAATFRILTGSRLSTVRHSCPVASKCCHATFCVYLFQKRKSTTKPKKINFSGISILLTTSLKSWKWKIGW